ncbi:hypothetical protein H6768_00265 [Candidatus Peribacteria bacterium]|nr:hypothetical protein [Candidatus Peribacteria bacterium]
MLDKKTSGFPRRNPRLQILDDTTVKVVKNDVPPTSIVVVPRVEFSQEISDKPSFDTVLGILNKYLEDTPKKIVLKSILTFGFSAARLRQELEKITLDDVYIVGTEDEWNWYVTIESLLIFAFKCDDGKKIHPSAI